MRPAAWGGDLNARERRLAVPALLHWGSGGCPSKDTIRYDAGCCNLHRQLMMNIPVCYGSKIYGRRAARFSSAISFDYGASVESRGHTAHAIVPPLSRWKLFEITSDGILYLHEPGSPAARADASAITHPQDPTYIHSHRHDNRTGSALNSHHGPWR